MSLQGFYTTKGLALAAKVAAGTKLTITKVTAGSGITAESASALAQERQTLTAGTAETGKQAATLPVTLAEVNAAASYSLTELGVYARDPGAGEILYQVFRMDEARPIMAGGESVYRFYLKETVGVNGATVTCSPAGLLVDEDLAPVRSKVLAVNVRSRTVTVAAAELPAYVGALPRMLTEHLTINVSGGDVPEALRITGFYGSGTLTIAPVSGAAVTITKGIYVTYCSALISLNSLTLSGEGYAGGSDSALLYIRTSRADAYLCTFDSDGSHRGVVAAYQSQVRLHTCGITHTSYALSSEGATVLSAYNCTGSDNMIGVRAGYGSIAVLSGSTPELMGGTANDNSGLIARNGTVI